MIHNLRLVMDDDSTFRQMMLDMNRQFHHQVISGEEMIAFMQRYFQIDIHPILHQYLDHTDVPKLVYSTDGDQLSYHWTQCHPDFNMPIDVSIDGNKVRLTPTTTMQYYQHAAPIHEVSIAPIWYIDR